MAGNEFARGIQDVSALKNSLILHPNCIITMQPWNVLSTQH